MYIVYNTMAFVCEKKAYTFLASRYFIVALSLQRVYKKTFYFILCKAVRKLEILIQKRSAIRSSVALIRLQSDR